MVPVVALVIIVIWSSSQRCENWWIATFCKFFICFNQEKSGSAGDGEGTRSQPRFRLVRCWSWVRSASTRVRGETVGPCKLADKLSNGGCLVMKRAIRSNSSPAPLPSTNRCFKQGKIMSWMVSECQAQPWRSSDTSVNLCFSTKEMRLFTSSGCAMVRRELYENTVKVRGKLAHVGKIFPRSFRFPLFGTDLEKDARYHLLWHKAIQRFPGSPKE